MEGVINTGELTADLGGSASTGDVGAAVLARISGQLPVSVL